jgi:ABC-type ATPase involved in cell division
MICVGLGLFWCCWIIIEMLPKDYYLLLNHSFDVVKFMPLAFIIGTAGSGKSFFTAAFSEWLKMSKQDVAVVNLDPGALKLPYSPDVDVRN